jgi:hypothetical protein
MTFVLDSYILRFSNYRLYSQPMEHRTYLEAALALSVNNTRLGTENRLVNGELVTLAGNLQVTESP